MNKNMDERSCLIEIGKLKTTPMSTQFAFRQAQLRTICA